MHHCYSLPLPTTLHTRTTASSPPSPPPSPSSHSPSSGSGDLVIGQIQIMSLILMIHLRGWTKRSTLDCVSLLSVVIRSQQDQPTRIDSSWSIENWLMSQELSPIHSRIRGVIHKKKTCWKICWKICQDLLNWENEEIGVGETYLKIKIPFQQVFQQVFFSLWITPQVRLDGGAASFWNSLAWAVT